MKTMRLFNTLLKTEAKLALRSMDAVVFGILFPMLVIVVLGAIYGNKPAFEGASYTFIQQSFGATASIGICATGLMGIPLTIADYRHRKILKRFQVTPISPMLLLIVQFMVQFAIAVVSFSGVFIVSSLFFGYQMIGSSIRFVLSSLLVTAAIYSIGMLLASVAPNIKTANLLCTIIYFPMLFLSGATVPYEIMPKTMQRVLDFLPLAQGIKLLKSCSLGVNTESILFPICLLAGITILCTILSLKFFRWE